MAKHAVVGCTKYYLEAFDTIYFVSQRQNSRQHDRPPSQDATIAKPLLGRLCRGLVRIVSQRRVFCTTPHWLTTPNLLLLSSDLSFQLITMHVGGGKRRVACMNPASLFMTVLSFSCLQGIAFLTVRRNHRISCASHIAPLTLLAFCSKRGVLIPFSCHFFCDTITQYHAAIWGQQRPKQKKKHRQCRVVFCVCWWTECFRHVRIGG